MKGSGHAARAKKSEEKVKHAYRVTQSLLQEHAEQMYALHADIMEHASRALLEHHAYTDDEMRRIQEFLDDPIMIFRFLRRANFDTDTAQSMLYKTAEWRMEGAIDELPQDLLHSPYMDTTASGVPLFWMHSRFRDKLGRPALYARLQNVDRMPNGLQDLKKTIIATFEMMRRYLVRINRRTKRGDPVVQCVVVLDVMDAGLSNIELDMLPFFMDLLKNHYPGVCGAVYVLRYSWFHAGIWRMLRPILPPKLLERLFFVEGPELLAHFDHNIPRSLGGPLGVSIASDSSDIFNYYVRAAAWSRSNHTSSASAHGTPSSSSDPAPPSLRIRQQDFGTIYDVMSQVGSPYASITPLTPHTSVPNTPRLRAQMDSPVQLRDLPTSPEAYRWRRAQQQPQSMFGWITSWFGSETPQQSVSGDLTPAVPEIVKERPHSATSTPRAQSTPNAAQQNDNAPAQTAEQPTYATGASNTVTRYLSWRAHKYAEMDGHVSPYNIENPYFGYPASYVTDNPESMDMISSDAADAVSTSGARPAGLLRGIHVRRRKRDLVRTLTYLFMLRLVRLYHMLRQSVNVVVWNMLGPRRAWASLGRTAPGKRPSKFIRRRVLILLAVLLYVQLPRTRMLSLRSIMPHFKAIV